MRVNRGGLRIILVCGCLLFVDILRLQFRAGSGFEVQRYSENFAESKGFVGYSCLGPFQIEREVLPWLNSSSFLIVAHVNRDTVELFRNFHLFMLAAAPSTKLFIITESREVLNFVDNHIHFVLFLDEPGSGASTLVDFGSREYRNLIYTRTEIVSKLLFAELNVLIVDIDSVWLKNPIDYLLTLPSFDIAGQVDGNRLCGGFLSLNGSSHRVQRLWKEVTEAYKGFSTVDSNDIQSTEQGILHQKLEKNFSDLHVIHLPSNLFPSGKIYFTESYRNMSPIIVHNNYIVGVQKKIARFKTYGLWRI